MMKKLLTIWLLSLCVSVTFAMTIQERQKYLEWFKKALLEVPQFTEWQEKTGELPPDFDLLPRTNLLPDPLRFSDGTPVGNSPADWEKRRAEIMQLFEKWMLGTFPPKPTIGKVELIDETQQPRYTVRNVKVLFGPDNKASVRIQIFIPTGAPGQKFPVMISPNLMGLSTSLLRRGYISCGFAGNDGMDDAAQLADIYPDYDFAALPRRAWLAGIVLDYLETLPQVDMKRIAINGYSRDGKMATIATMLNNRISAVIAGSTGVGGVVPWRLSGERGGGESIESTTRMFPNWFVPRLRYFSGKEDYLPVDANFFLAMIAPRAALLQWGYNDEVANGWAMEQAYQSAIKVYDRLGAKDKLDLIPVPGFHGSNDQEACLDWLDIQFGKSSMKWTTNFIYPWNFAQWQQQTGEKVTADYQTPAVSATAATTQNAWTEKVPVLKKAIQWMLGNTPPTVVPNAAAGGRAVAARPGGGTPTGVSDVAQWRPNPGQLLPDVPGWVINRGSMEFGWTADGNKLVGSKKINFGGVTGDFFFPAGTPENTKLPTVIWLHGFHYPLGYMWVYRRDLHPVLALAKEGYAVLAFDMTGFGMRWKEAAPFYNRYPDWSRMGKMVEDVQNAVTTLQQEAMVDSSKIWVFGYTMGGTVGLYAAALDERIAGAVSICGFTPMRTDTPDKGTSGMTRYSHLYGLIPRLGLFAGQEKNLPYDYDDLMAMVAPRPLLVVQPARDRDATPADVRTAVSNAKKIYTLQGAGNKIALQEPDDYARFPASTQDKVIEWMKTNF